MVEHNLSCLPYPHPCNASCLQGRKYRCHHPHGCILQFRLLGTLYQLLDGERQLLGGRIAFNNHGGDGIANVELLEDLIGILFIRSDQVVLADQAFDVTQNLHKYAKVSHIGDDTADGAELRIVVAQGLPRIAFKLFHAKADPAVVGLDTDDHNVDHITFCAEGRHILDLLGPGNVIDVQKAVDAFLEVDESAAIGDFHNRLGKCHADRITLHNGIPGIFLKLFEAQRDTLLVQVIPENLCLDDITDIQDFLGVVDPLGPGQLGDMGKTLDAGLDFDECTEGGDFGHRCLDGVTDIVFLFKGGPGLFLHVLQGQVELLGFGIDVDKPELYNLSLLHEILRTGDMAPAHVIDMQQSIKTAKVNEGTEGGKGFDHTFDNVTDLNGGEELLFIFLDFLVKVLTSVHHALELGAAVELVDDEVISYSDQSLRFLDTNYVSLGEGAEPLVLASEINLEATLDHFLKFAQNGDLLSAAAFSSSVRSLKSARFLETMI